MKVDFLDYMGSDLSVVNAARVSFNKVSTELNDQDKKLIKYLASHNHWTPFAHTCLQFRIEAPVFVARQLVKHQIGLVWNEVSRRYVDYDPGYHIPTAWRGKPTDKKQGSSDQGIDLSQYDFSGGPLESDDDAELVPTLNNEFYEHVVRSQTLYESLLKAGVAPEQARMVLPLNHLTEWIWSGSLYAFARVCKLRISDDAQVETRFIAEEIEKHCRIQFPVSMEALLDS